MRNFSTRYYQNYRTWYTTGGRRKKVERILSKKKAVADLFASWFLQQKGAINKQFQSILKLVLNILPIIILKTYNSSEEETEIVDDITLNDGLLLNSNDNYNSANEMLLKNILGDINEFPSHEHDFMEKLMEQDRLPLHTSDTLYNTKEAKQWIHEIDNVKKMDDIKNGLMMAWENFEVKHEVYSSRNSGSHNTRYKMNKKK